MRIYELVVILRSSLSEEKRKKMLETIKGWLPEIKIKEENVWGQKPLAYPIKKEKSGYYMDYVFESENAIPMDFEKRLLGQDDILRHLLIRKN